MLRQLPLCFFFLACSPPTDVVLAVGAEHTCLLVAGETPRCFGGDSYGQLAATTGFGPSLDIAAGGYTTCAVDLERNIHCAGHNHHGQLGDGTLDASPTPVRAEGVPPALAVRVGFAHTCALLEDGGVVCWGWNSIGQAVPGQGLDAAPARVEGLPPIVELVTGYAHTCGFDADRNLYCWGQLTDGQVMRMADHADAVAIGVDHLCIATDHVTCLGHMPGGGRPEYPPEGRTFDVDAVLATGAIDHVCFGTADGALCMGKNIYGQLGDGRFDDLVDEPTAVRELPGPLDALAVGDRHSCAVHAGAISCWGDNHDGQLGDGTRISSLVPISVPLR